MTLETLLIKIRADPKIKGLTVGDETYKVQAFADDLMFIIEEPITTVPILLQTIEQYGKVAGLKINKSKTHFLTKNMNKTQETKLESISGIKTVKKVKYLGINLTAKTITLKNDNYMKLLSEIKKDLAMWNNLKISFLGRIATIKMNTLPKVLFLFQVIPINPGGIFLKTLTNLVKKFIWQGKKARIKMNCLEDIKERGGFGLPNWKLYYQAAALTWLREWITLDNKRILNLEGHDLMLGWHAFIWYDKDKNHSYFKRHTLRKYLLEVWKDIKKNHFLNIPEWLAPLEAITHPKSIKDKKITHSYKELLNDQMKLKSRMELQEEGIMIDWWHYAQIRSRYQKDKTLYIFNKSKNSLSTLITTNSTKMIGKIYKFLIAHKNIELTLKDTMIRWCRNIGKEIDIDTWEKVWINNWKMTKSVSLKENQIKMFYRWHLPPNRIAKMFPKTSPTCWKCKKDIGTYYHQWWTCGKAKIYWKMIEKILKEIIKQDIDNTPEFYLLGVINQTYKKEILYLIIHILTAARIIYAQNWKGEEIPKEEEVIAKILDCAEMDMMTRRLNDQEDTKFYETWNNVYKWIDKKK